MGKKNLQLNSVQYNTPLECLMEVKSRKSWPFIVFKVDNHGNNRNKQTK